MTAVSEPFPDIEIYVKGVASTDIEPWLQQHFGVTVISSGTSYLLTYQDVSSECLVVPNAVSGDFTSIWFKSNNTPWETDLDCANSAYAFFKKEIRCSAGSWEGEADGENESTTHNDEHDRGNEDENDHVNDHEDHENDHENSGWLRIDSNGTTTISWH